MDSWICKIDFEIRIILSFLWLEICDFKLDTKFKDRYFKNKNTHNAALAKMLNGQNSTCNENTAACDYLNAISYARSANKSMLNPYNETADHIQINGISTHTLYLASIYKL